MSCIIINYIKNYIFLIGIEKIILKEHKEKKVINQINLIYYYSIIKLELMIK